MPKGLPIRPIGAFVAVPLIGFFDFANLLVPTILTKIRLKRNGFATDEERGRSENKCEERDFLGHVATIGT